MTDDARTRRLRALERHWLNWSLYGIAHRAEYVLWSDVEAVLDTEGDRQTTTKRERYLARRQSPPELKAALVNARLEVNDWHECSTAEELARWREAQQRLIDAAEAVGQASVHASRELMGADTEGDRPARLPCGCYIAQCPTHRRQAEGDASPEKENDHADASDSRRSME